MKISREARTCVRSPAARAERGAVGRGIFHGGCLTGPNHSGVELHGFLSDRVKVAAREGEYTVFGYKGTQVRDQIHSADVVAAATVAAIRS